LVIASKCSTAKVKVAETGQSLADDIDRVEAVRSALGPSGRIRVDANGGWSVDEASDALAALSRFDLEYAEQPVRTLAEMAALRRRTDVPLAADESVRTAEDPLRIAGLEAADIVVLKVQPLGGVRACLRVAEACGLPVVVSSAIETSIGIAAGVALAAALPELPYACGLGTVPLLAGDVCADPLVPVAGRIDVREVVPDPELLARHAADEPAAQWWSRRIAAAQAMLNAVGPDAG
jgi:O-succinylbenzoate synthase